MAEHYQFLSKRIRKRALWLRIGGALTLVCVLGLITGIVQTLFLVESGVGQDAKLDVTAIQQRIDDVATTTDSLQNRIKEFAKAPQVEQDASAQGALKVAEFRASRLKEVLSKLDPEAIQTRFFVSLIVTRLSIVIVLLYLTSFFISLFRFTIRLASFLDARADVLEIMPSSTHVSPEKLADMLSPDRIDFAITRSPDKQAVELAKALLAAPAKAKKTEGDPE